MRGGLRGAGEPRKTVHGSVNLAPFLEGPIGFISNVKEPAMTAERYLGVTIAAMVMAGATGVAFAGWLGHGPEILLAVAQSGWCF